MPASRGEKRRSCFLWLGFHLTLLVLLVASMVLRGPIGVSNNLLDLIPSSEEMKGAAQAQKQFASQSSRTVLCFVVADDFSVAREGAVELQERLCATGAFESLGMDAASSFSLGEMQDELDRLKFQGLDEETCSLLEAGRYRDIADDALAMVYGAFQVQGLGRIARDPFLLSERESRFLLGRLSSMGGMAPKEGVLARQVDGSWFVMVQGELTEKAVAMQNKRDIAAIFSIAEALQAEGKVQVALSGIPFHSWESATSAQREIGLIGTISLLLVSLLFVWVFHSPTVILWLLADIVFSALAAMAAVCSAFGSLHLLTLVFGTSLIGTCVDYAVHYLLHMWWDEKALDPFASRNRIFKGIGTSFLSTLLCYSLLLLAPYRLLKEVALFSIAGLTSSFLTSMCLSPVFFSRFPVPRRGVDVGSCRMGWSGLSRNRRLLAIFVAAGALAVLSCAGLPRLGVHNDLASLYQTSERMRRNEALASGALSYASSTYTIVSGADESQVLAREKAFASAVRSASAGTVLATSDLIPPPEVQKRNVGLIRALYEKELASQCQALGLDPNEAWQEFASLTKRPFSVTQAKELPLLGALVDRLWLGEREGRCYSAVMVLDADLDAVETIAKSMEGIWFFHTVRDVSLQLDELTRSILRILCGSFVLMVVLLGWIYGWRRSLGYHLSPLVILLVTASAMVLLEGAVDFFTVVALVLSIGLGLDYVVFMMEMDALKRRQQAISFIAVAISYATSALSFGSLAFSSFRPVHLFGLAVFIGLTTAWCFALFMRWIRKDALHEPDQKVKRRANEGVREAP